MTLKEKTLEELHELYAHKLQMVRQAEGDIEEIRDEIKKRDPKFESMDIFSPITKMISEVEGNGIQMFLRNRDK